MEQLILDWEGPFKLSEPTSKKYYGVVGLYAVEHYSRIVYIGKAEYQGAMKEARSHGFYEKRLGEVGILWNISKALVYIGTVSQDQNALRIDDAENLLIFKLQPPCNKARIRKYKGIQPFRVINNGNLPQELPMEINYPDS